MTLLKAVAFLLLLAAAGEIVVRVQAWALWRLTRKVKGKVMATQKLDIMVVARRLGVPVSCAYTPEEDVYVFAVDGVAAELKGSFVRSANTNDVVNKLRRLVGGPG